MRPCKAAQALGLVLRVSWDYWALRLGVQAWTGSLAALELWQALVEQICNWGPQSLLFQSFLPEVQFSAGELGQQVVVTT